MMEIPPKNTILDKTECLMCGRIMNEHFTAWDKWKSKFVKVCDLQFFKLEQGDFD